MTMVVKQEEVKAIVQSLHRLGWKVQATPIKGVDVMVIQAERRES